MAFPGGTENEASTKEAFRVAADPADRGAVGLIASAVWIGRYGVPLLGLPKAEDVQSVTLVSLDSGSVTVTDTENVELLVKAANLLNYKLGAPDTTDPELTVTYTL